MSLSRRDRAAMQLALEWLRENPWHMVDRIDAAERALFLGGSTSRRVQRGMHGFASRSQPWRMTRARLALCLRAVLRADRGDCGPKRKRCPACGWREGIASEALTDAMRDCDEWPRDEWRPYRPLWEQAPATRVR